MNSTEYDPKILQKFADQLYSQASSVVGLFTILGLVVGGLIGLPMGAGVGAAVGAIVLGALGLVIGMSIAFQMKLRAQVILCQKQIEENTRKSIAVSNESARVTTASKSTGTDQGSVAHKYFFSVGGKNLGPYSLEEMRQLRKNGKLPDETLVFRDGDKDWHPATMFPETIF